MESVSSSIYEDILFEAFNPGFNFHHGNTSKSLLSIQKSLVAYAKVNPAFDPIRKKAKADNGTPDKFSFGHHTQAQHEQYKAYHTAEAAKHPVGSNEHEAHTTLAKSHHAAALHHAADQLHKPVSPIVSHKDTESDVTDKALIATSNAVVTHNASDHITAFKANAEAAMHHLAAGNMGAYEHHDAMAKSHKYLSNAPKSTAAEVHLAVSHVASMVKHVNALTNLPSHTPKESTLS